MNPTLVYCYDAYCGWCYGFTPVMRRIFNEFGHQMVFDVVSGGMILPAKPRPIAVIADFVRAEYKAVEEQTGVRFGKDYLWHIENPAESDWLPFSEKPAIALCVFREYYDKLAVLFAEDLQYALHYDGRDLCDDEAYRNLLEKYGIPQLEFYERLHSETYRARAYEDFAYASQLGVTGFPTVFLQLEKSKLHLLTRGYTDYNSVRTRIIAILEGRTPSS